MRTETGISSMRAGPGIQSFAATASVASASNAVGKKLSVHYLKRREQASSHSLPYVFGSEVILDNEFQLNTRTDQYSRINLDFSIAEVDENFLYDINGDGKRDFLIDIRQRCAEPEFCHSNDQGSTAIPHAYTTSVTAYKKHHTQGAATAAYVLRYVVFPKNSTIYHEHTKYIRLRTLVIPRGLMKRGELLRDPSVLAGESMHLRPLVITINIQRLYRVKKKVYSLI